MKGGGKLMGQQLRCGRSVYMGNLKLDFVMIIFKCWCCVFCRFHSHSTEIQNDTKYVHVQNIEVSIQITKPQSQRVLTDHERSII
jgi:hypothetical protein